jgi:heptosyltransferase-1
MDADQLTEIRPQRGCLIKPSALGDVVQTLPLLAALNQRFPETCWSWVINSGLDGLLEGHPGLDGLLKFPRHGRWRDWLSFLRELRRQRFDLVIDLQGLARTGLMVAASGARWRVGLQTAREGAGLTCNVTIPDSGRDVPAHERYLRVAQAFGWSGERPPVNFRIPDRDRRRVSELLGPLPRPWLAVHAGARWSTKRWPLASYAETVAQTVRSHAASIVLIGARDEQSECHTLQRLIQDRVPGAKVLDLSGQTSLKELVALLSLCDCLLTNDSGPMHLADAAKTPVVGLFTCTSAVRSGPPGPQHVLLQAGVDCAASYHKKCPHRGAQHHCCFDSIEIARVRAALDQQLSNRQQRQPA